MKTILNYRIFLCIVLIQFFSIHAYSQKSGNGNVISKSFEVSNFSGIDVGGAFKITVIQAEGSSVLIETDENLLSEISVKVNNGVLKIENGKIRNATKLSAIITMPVLATLEVSGAAKVKSEGIIKSDLLKIMASGASQVNMTIEVERLETELSGASNANIDGVATQLLVDMSGAAKLQANDLVTKTTKIDGSGASYAYINAVENLETNMSGAAKVKYDKAPANEENEKVVVSSNVGSGYSGDTVNVNVGNIKIKVIDGDSTVVVVGNRKLVVDENGNVNLSKKEKTHKFDGHWAGFELGINGLLTSDFNMNYPVGQEYLDLQMEKSINVNLNFYEQNFRLNQKGTLGLVSGMGLTWNNYRFDPNVMVRNENSQLEGYYMQGVSVKKSKLTNVYLTVPLYLELQSIGTQNKDKAHIAIGVVGGWRFSSHTKIYFNEANKEYRLVDPLTGTALSDVLVTPGNTNRNIVKEFNGFQQQTLKLDASVRIGWGIVNIFANYSLTGLFIENRGPELYPAAIGLTIAGW